MGLDVVTDRDTVAALARAFLARDPVRGTVLGTIGEGLGPGAWAAHDDERLAIRSDAPHPVQLVGDWDADAQAGLVGALDGLPGLAGLAGPSGAVRAVSTALGRPATTAIEEGLFRCDDLTAPTEVTGRPARAGNGRHELLVRWVQEFVVEAHGGFGSPADFVARTAGGCWLWLDDAGTPVSMAFRRTVHSGSARIGPVYTPPERRGHGYGSAVTAAATRDVLDDGAVPVLFTDLANPTSNRIYRAIGYRPVEQRLLVRLAD